MPGAEHDAARLLAVELELVHRRPVGMAVNQRTHAAAAQRGGDGGLIGVHDLPGGALRMALAALAGLLGKAAPDAKRQAQEAALPAGTAHHATQQLIGPVGGTQRIAMREQHRLAVQVDDDRIGDQAHAGAARETALIEEVAIAVHDIARYPMLSEAGERHADAIPIRFVIVIADPGVEQVAENVERVGAAGAKREKVDELRAGRRLAGIQMQIGDEQGSQGGSLGADS